AALEERRPVRAGEDADLALDGADLVGLAAVCADAALDDQAARDRLLEPLEGLLGLRAPLGGLGELAVGPVRLDREVLVEHGGAELVHPLAALALALDLPGLGERLLDQLADLLDDLRRGHRQIAHPLLL